jgi:COP9 signalosome complex subunit 12
MDTLFADFAQAYATSDGYLLSTTLSPNPPRNDPGRLYAFRGSTNAHGLTTELRYKLQYNPDLQLDKKESQAWQETFASFWKFLGVLLAAEEAQNVGSVHEADWSGVYESWKEFVNVLYRGYQANLFGAWTIPCLYNAGKFLRIFAIKADEKSAATQRDSGINFAAGGLQEEDMLGSESKNEKLEDATRQINRIFGLCISDR